MQLEDETRSKIESLINSNDVVLFMKGNRQMPQCGFSSRVVQILDGLIPDYDTLDVLANPDIRDGIKLYSSWPTVPQLYVRASDTSAVRQTKGVIGVFSTKTATAEQCRLKGPLPNSPYQSLPLR